MASYSPTGAVTTFTERLLAGDLPDLDPARRTAAAEFSARRTGAMASPMRVGVAVVALVVDAVGRVVGPARLARFLSSRPLPVLGEYVRLVRSLTYAYIWETWPDTGPTGASVTAPADPGGEGAASGQRPAQIGRGPEARPDRARRSGRG